LVTPQLNSSLVSGPLAFGKRDGDDAKIVLPGLGTFGVGDVKSSIAKFIPAGMSGQIPNGGTFELADKPNLGYMDRETTAGKTSGSTSKVGNPSKDIWPTLISRRHLFPFMQLPPLKSDGTPDYSYTAVDPKLGDVLYPKPKSYTEEAEKLLEVNPPPPKTPFTKVSGQHSFYGRLIYCFNAFVRVFLFTLPLLKLGLSQKEVYALCSRFAPVAAKHCYGTKVEDQFLEKCRGYNEDCSSFFAQERPLGAIANAFSSGVGLTYYTWDVNGIPYYPINEEGSIGNGHNARIDFGSWGGGYSDNLGVRDFWSQTQEYGGNWYEGTYGYKTGWSIPLVQSAGVEGGGGTQVNIPIKEGELGRPIMVTNGYHVGPYFGTADRVGVDWYNGGVSWNRGVASPFVGVGVNTGTSIGFPSIATFMNQMGITDVSQLSQILAAGVRTHGASVM
uniref:Amidase domain-containing protein n=1 Tax=Angiostrongylus cantonensis TaxID=6313 RepID=A0A158P5U5_ANGCA